MAGHVFISHTSKDDAFVRLLREKLEPKGIATWVDSRELVGGSKLEPEIERAIENARAFVVVLSPNTVNSPWVRKEIKKALEVEAEKKGDGYRVIPLLLPGISPSALGMWFDEEPVGIAVELKTGGVDEALIPILEALGERLPIDRATIRTVPAAPVEELILRLQDPRIEEREGTRRAAATATLIYHPADTSKRAVESPRFKFTAPLGAIEHAEIRWYLEEYHRWPVGVFHERAERTAKQLPTWGQFIYQAALGTSATQEVRNAWENARSEAARRFSVEVDADLPDGTSDEEKAAAQEAASALMALPWELLNDGRNYLFKGRYPVRVRRRLPNRHPMDRALAKLPIRVLLLSPRPDDEHANYIDHRLSALALVAAVENLGDLVEMDVLTPPTFPALRKALEEAAKAGNPYEVIHFDGHGVYDQAKGLGALVFEDPRDDQKLSERRSELIHADQFAQLLRDYRIPLVFLEACQGAQFDLDPTASVAARLLDAGVTSVVAMTHSVLVETARRFTTAFYQALAEGQRVGDAMLAGQKALEEDSFRGAMMGAGELRLQDWFVPVLYQEEQDPQLFDRLPEDEIKQLQAKEHKLRLGALPKPPPHTFIGRSKELLALERLLLGSEKPYAVIVGQGGAGKTTIAVELARWLRHTGRFRRVAFASLEFTHDARALLDTLGRQLLPDGDKYSVAQYKTMKEALLPVERALRDEAVLLVVDNVESILSSHDVQGNKEKAIESTQAVQEILNLLNTLLSASPKTRLILTSRERLPAPFDAAGRGVRLGALSPKDAVDLVSHVLITEGLDLPTVDAGETPEEVTGLVEAVGRHARALVLIAHEVATRGVRATTKDLAAIMIELEQRHPGERENSLYASVELSLRRIPAELHRRMNILGVFQGGYTFGVLVMLLDNDQETAKLITNALITVGLAELDEYNYIHLDPALPPYLRGQMNAEEQAAVYERWGQAMQVLINFLYDQRFQDAKLAARLTLLELPNLLAALEWAEVALTPKDVTLLAGQIEQLLAGLDRPRALVIAISVRERANAKLGEWSRARFESERLNVERLLETGNLPAALGAAQSLLQNVAEAGEGAYSGVAYDIALAYFLLGRVLSDGGAAEPALKLLAEAHRRFEFLVNAGDKNAARMVGVSVVESGDCLRALGRLEEAADAYEEGIRRAEKLEDKRQVAVTSGQLGTVRLLQQRYSESLSTWTEARLIFEELGEPESIAITWHQIGVVHRYVGDFAAAERAYRQALAIDVGRGDRRGQASTLDDIGILYSQWNRKEESVVFHQQAADIRSEIKDLNAEGRSRSNMARVLIELRRYDEARRELLRAIECKQSFGHAAELWKTWIILHNLEKAVGDLAAAARAREQGIEAYLAYRRDGGESTSNRGPLFVMVEQAITSKNRNQTSDVRNQLVELGKQEMPDFVQAVILKLQAILNGSRDLALAKDPALNYDDAAELRLLLERLGS